MTGISLFEQTQAARERELNVRKRILRLLLSAGLVWPIAALAVGLGISAFAVGVIFIGGQDGPGIHRLLLLSVVVSLVGLIFVGIRLRAKLLKPLVLLEDSIAHVTEGDPGAHLDFENTGVLEGMIRDIDSLNEELTDLYEDMDSRVARHTTRLAQKTASLKILYDVAASINQAQNLDDLLIQFLRIFKEMVNGRAATVRLVMPDKRLRLVGSIGLDNEVLLEHDLLPVKLCVCGKALSPGDILCEHDPNQCAEMNRREMFGSDRMELISVPLDYHGQTLGLYNIFVEKPGVSQREDVMDLLKTIGSHLGMAVAKQRSDADARRLSIIQERTNLAHELHDSLAQTLASLRFQVRMLQDTLASSEAGVEAMRDVERIRNALDEAHVELRELLNSFRAPIDQRGLIPALEKLARRYQEETGLHVFFQKHCAQTNLSASEEMQILRIVQEALANVRKHADAHTVRILLTRHADDVYVILIEDDGVGFDSTQREGRPGEHIGLSIMQERAHRLGGILRIESEPGEGTRVELAYKPDARLSEPYEATGTE